MKKFKIIIFCLGVTLLIAIAYYAGYFINNNNSAADHLEAYTVKELQYDFPFIINSEGSTLDLENVVLTNSKNERQNFENIIGKSKPLLVFRITPGSCSICVNREINNLNQLEVDKDRVVILTGYGLIREYFIFLKYNELKFPVYNVEDLDIPAEKANNAYLFVINGENKVQNLFFPLRNNNAFSEIYYSEIAPKLTNTGDGFVAEGQEGCIEK